MPVNKFKKLNFNKKIIFILLLVFIVGITVSNFIISAVIEKNYVKKIEEDLISDKKNIEFYTKQFLMMNDKNNTELGFTMVANDIIKQLNSINNHKYIAYNLKGEVISKEIEDEFLNTYRDDLIKAVNGESTYTLINKDRDELFINFSTPVFVDGNQVGILRFNKDYSFFRKQGNEISLNVFIVISITFLFIYFILSTLLKHLISPVMDLSNHSTIVTRGIEEDKYKGGEIPYLYVNKSNDEIGRLIDNYNQMLIKINEQLTLIRDDRNSILKLYNHKKDFYDNVTHELKTPLTTIKGYAEIIKNNGFKDKDFFDKGIEHITGESERLHKMVVQLLEMAQKDEDMKLEILDVSLILKSVVEGMRLKANRYGNTINLNVEKFLYINGNEDKIKELVINLLDNAIKYGRENTEIVLKAYKDGTNIQLEVTNEGIGLREEEQEAIFTPFYRINKKNSSRELGSTGLGLSICQKIVKDHRGYMTVNSVVEKVTTFKVAFPIEKGGISK